MVTQTQHNFSNLPQFNSEREKGDKDDMRLSILQDLMDAGKVKAIGVSELSLAQAQTIHAIVPVSLIEVEWSLFNRQAEVSLFYLHFLAL